MEASARGHHQMTSLSLWNHRDFLSVWAKCFIQLEGLVTPVLLTHTVLSLSITSQWHKVRGLGFLSSLQISSCFSKRLAESKQMLALVCCGMLTGVCDWSHYEYTAGKELKYRRWLLARLCWLVALLRVHSRTSEFFNGVLCQLNNTYFRGSHDSVPCSSL